MFWIGLLIYLGGIITGLAIVGICQHTVERFRRVNEEGE